MKRNVMTARSLLARGAVIGGVALLIGLLITPAASAHVKVSGTDVTPGGYGVITFRVPSESDTASTTEIAISFPDGTPFTSVDTQPKAGWSATVTKKALKKPIKGEGGTITEYVSRVDFRARNAAAAIPPGEFDLFNLSVGPLPKSGSVSFGALQKYSDGSTVNWNEQSGDGTAEPDHPAPTLDLSSTTGAAPAADRTHRTTASSDSGSASWPGITGLVLGAIALVLSVATLLMVRSSRGTVA